MPRSKRMPESEIDNIRANINSLKTNVAALSHNLKDELKSEATGQIVKAKEKGLDTLERLEGNVKAKPAQSLLTAFGAGLVLSALFRRF